MNTEHNTIYNNDVFIWIKRFDLSTNEWLFVITIIIQPLFLLLTSDSENRCSSEDSIGDILLEETFWVISTEREFWSNRKDRLLLFEWNHKHIREMNFDMKWNMISLKQLFVYLQERRSSSLTINEINER